MNQMAIRTEAQDVKYTSKNPYVHNINPVAPERKIAALFGSERRNIKWGKPWYERPLNIIILGAVFFVFVLFWGICQSEEKSTGGGNLTKDESRMEQKPNRAAIPSLKIAAKYDMDTITYAVLVPKNINREQLKNLIFEFRKAREEGSLSKTIPSTTLQDNLRVDINGVAIYVFSEPSWATESKFKRWMESSLSGAEAKVDKQYVNHIKAYYSYSAPLGEEEGCIGFSGRGAKSSDYESLFYNREPPDNTAEPCPSCGAKEKEPPNK